MWKARNCVSLLLLLASLCWLPALGSCSPNQTHEISETELAMFENRLNELEANNSKLESLLNVSTLDLNEAQQMSIDLQMALTESQRTVQELQKELTILRNESASAKQSLARANEELQNASASFKQYEIERDKIEGRLRTQRNIWEALFVIACGVAVAR